jgi:hypothetical protein
MLVMVSTGAAQPWLEFSEDSFNFGYCLQRSAVAHTFWIRSTGTDSLEIRKVAPGCGCTKAPLDKEIIPPGDSARLEIIFSTRRYDGPVTKHPRVLANDGLPDHRLEISAVAVPDNDSTWPLVFEPMALDLAVGAGKIRTEKPFTITNVSDKDCDIGLVAYPKDLLKITLPTTVKAGATVGAKIELIELPPPEGFAKSFTIEAEDGLGTRYSIPVECPASDSLSGD